jgi:hypothetical protein
MGKFFTLSLMLFLFSSCDVVLSLLGLNSNTDLSIKNVEIVPQPTGDIVLSYTIVNLGSGSPREVPIGFYLSSDNVFDPAIDIRTNHLEYVPEVESFDQEQFEVRLDNLKFDILDSGTVIPVDGWYHIFAFIENTDFQPDNNISGTSLSEYFPSSDGTQFQNIYYFQPGELIADLYLEPNVQNWFSFYSELPSGHQLRFISQASATPPQHFDPQFIFLDRYFYDLGFPNSGGHENEILSLPDLEQQFLVVSSQDGTSGYTDFFIGLTQDSFEPNDNIGTASSLTIPVNILGTLHHDFIGMTDTDVYTFNISTDGIDLDIQIHEMGPYNGEVIVNVENTFGMILDSYAGPLPISFYLPSMNFFDGPFSIFIEPLFPYSAIEYTLIINEF